MFSPLYKTCSLLGCLSLLFSCADGPNVVQKELQVSGNCEMCKETIENALDLDGIKKANWDVDKKILEVKFDTLLINLPTIARAVANAGYDNALFRADDSTYTNLHECCQYDRKTN